MGRMSELHEATLVDRLESELSAAQYSLHFTCNELEVITKILADVLDHLRGHGNHSRADLIVRMEEAIEPYNTSAIENPP